MAAGVQPNMNAWGVYKDLGLGKNAYLTGDNWDTDITVTNGPASISLTTFFTGSNGYKWSGEAWDADMDVLTNPNVNSLGVFKDNSTNKNAMIQGEAWDADMTIVNAPSMNALNVFRDNSGGKNLWWYGGVPADATTAVAVPYTENFNMVWDVGSSKWNRMSQPTGGTTVTVSDSMDAGPTGIASASYTTFYRTDNTAKYQRWTGEQYGTAMTAAPEAPFVLSLGSFYELGSTRSYRIQGELWDLDMAGTINPNTNAFNVYYNLNTAKNARWEGEAWDVSIDQTANAPSTIALNAFYDATTSKGFRWNGGSLTSSIGAPVTGPYVGSIMYGYSSTGPTYYPVKADATGIYVHQADLAPGEDAVNDWKKVRVESVAVYTPGYTDTASVAVAATEVMASVEVLGYSNMSFTCKNTGVTNLIDTTYLYIAPNGSDWQVIATNTTDIAPGATARVFQISNNSDRYMKMMASSNASTTSSRCWLTARVTN